MAIETQAPPHPPPEIQNLKDGQSSSDSSNGSDAEKLFEEVAQGFDSFKESVSDFTQSVSENPFVKDMLDGFSIAWSSVQTESSMMEEMEQLFGETVDGQARFVDFKKSYETMRATLLTRPDGIEQLHAVNDALSRIADADSTALKGSDGKPIFDKDSLAHIAESLIYNVNNPAAEDNQGRTLSCTPMSVMVTMGKLDPGRYAALIADIATTGKFKDSAGNEITVDSDSLRLSAEMLKVKGSTQDSGEISAATHLFTVGLGQMSAEATIAALGPIMPYLSAGQLTPEFLASHPELKFVYKQVPLESKDDTGERVGYTYQEKNPDGTVKDVFEEFSLNGNNIRGPMSQIPAVVAVINRRLFGEELGNNLYVARLDNFPPEQVIDGVNLVESQEDFAKALQSKLDQGILPQVMTRMGMNDLFHSVSVLGMRTDPETGAMLLTLSDHFGREGFEREMALSTLYKMMNKHVILRSP